MQQLAIAFLLLVTPQLVVAEQPHHGGGHHGGHGGHGAIAKGIEKFPTVSYTEHKSPRKIQSPLLASIQGDAAKGKQLAQKKGRCLSCHIMGADFDQAGNVGPNLSNYANLNRSRRYSFQQIWDARAHTPNTIMPPLGSNEVLSTEEVMDLIAYLETLKSTVNIATRAKVTLPNYYVAAEDLTFADIYIDEGQALFNKPGKNGQSCASCHASSNAKAPSLKKIASHYPKFDHHIGETVLIETRNNYCRQTYMDSPPYKLGSRASNTLSAYVKYLSRNTPIAITPNVHTQESLLKGKQSFYKKTGQLNFSCADCHVKAANKWLRGQLLSDIQPQGKNRNTAATWPRHFVSLHDLGLISLQQRIRHCQVVTRTYPQKLGSEEYIDMELYITSLANGLPMKAPTKSKPRGAE